MTLNNEPEKDPLISGIWNPVTLTWIAIAMLAVFAIYAVHGKGQAESQLAEMTSQRQAAQQLAEEASASRDMMGKEIERLKTAEADAIRLADTRKADAKNAAAKAAESDERAKSLGNDVSSLKARVLDVEGREAKAKQDIDAANRLRAEADAAASSLRSEIEGLKSQLAAAADEISKLKLVPPPAPASTPPAP